MIGLIGFVFLASFFLTLLLIRLPGSFWPIDRPNRRSLHAVPVRRVGGIAILLAILLGVLGAYAAYGATAIRMAVLVPAGVGLILVFAVSFWDDFHGAPVSLRLGIQLLATVPLVLSGFVLRSLALPGVVIALPGPVAIGLTVLWIVWMANLYNFMDGSDGLAAAMAAIGFGAFALIGFSQGHDRFGGAASLIAASALGFLALNLPPARVFMGDGGSVVIGYLVAAFALWADRRGIFPLWVGALVFSPFIADATLTLIARLIRGRSLAQAHRDHAYQRLVRAGWSKPRVLITSALYMVAAGLLGTLAALDPDPTMRIALFAGWIVTLVSSLTLVYGREIPPPDGGRMA